MPNGSCAIANVGVQGMTPDDLARAILLEKYKVFTVAIDGAGRSRMCGVTPQVYTSTAHLDTLRTRV